MNIVCRTEVIPLATNQNQAIYTPSSSPISSYLLGEILLVEQWHVRGGTDRWDDPTGSSETARGEEQGVYPSDAR